MVELKVSNSRFMCPSCFHVALKWCTSKCTPQIIGVILSHNWCQWDSQADTVTQFRDPCRFIDWRSNYPASPKAPAPSALPPSPLGLLSCWSFSHPSFGPRGRAEGCLQSPGTAVAASPMSTHWAHTSFPGFSAALYPQAPLLPLQSS